MYVLWVLLIVAADMEDRGDLGQRQLYSCFTGQGMVNEATRQCTRSIDRGGGAYQGWLDGNVVIFVPV